jgi:hypothetical protein
MQCSYAADYSNLHVFSLFKMLTLYFLKLISVIWGEYPCCIRFVRRNAILVFEY